MTAADPRATVAETPVGSAYTGIETVPMLAEPETPVVATRAAPMALALPVDPVADTEGTVKVKPTLTVTDPTVD
jgi:hypothetical protein